MSGTEPEGGDPVCWLDRVCPECGAFRENPALPGCARCGAVFGAHEGLGNGAADGSGDRSGGGPAHHGADRTADGPADRGAGVPAPGHSPGAPGPSRGD